MHFTLAAILYLLHVLKVSTSSVRKYLSSKWIKGDASRRILVLDTSLFIHFDDKYFWTEGVEQSFNIYIGLQRYVERRGFFAHVGLLLLVFEVA